MTRGLPIRLVSSAWPSTLRILCAPVWLRSSRLSRIRAPGLRREPGGVVEHARRAGVVAQQPVELGLERLVGQRVAVGRVELVERRDERLGHEPAAEPAEVAGRVGQQAGALDERSPRSLGPAPRLIGPAAASPGGCRR